MSATLKTQNYNLPVFAEEDFTDWGSYNEAMEIIDSSMQENKEKIETVEEAEQSGAAAIQQIQQSIVSMGNSIEHQQQNLNSLTTRVENNESHDNDRDLAITEIQNEVSSYDGRIIAINDSVNNLKQDVTDVESMNNIQEQKINLNTTKIQQNTTAIQKNETDIQENSTRIDNTNERINNIQLSVNYPIKYSYTNKSQLSKFLEFPSNINFIKAYQIATYTRMDSYNSNVFRNIRKLVIDVELQNADDVADNKCFYHIPLKDDVTFYYGFVTYGYQSEHSTSHGERKISGLYVSDRFTDDESSQDLVFIREIENLNVVSTNATIVMEVYTGD